MNTLNFKNRFLLLIVALVLFGTNTPQANADETTSTPPADLAPIVLDITAPTIDTTNIPTTTETTVLTTTTTNQDTTSTTTTISELIPGNISSVINELTTTNTPTVNLNIRYNNNLIFSKSVNLPTSTTIIDDRGNTENTTSTTVLTTLISAQQETRDFYISSLQHSDYGYYLKCLYLSLNSTSTCDNWNYVVDNRYPSVGMDSYLLKGNENIYIYFGDSWKITTNRNAYTNTTTPFYTWKYQYDDINKDWVMDPNDLIAITIPNPNPTGWWDTDITVSTTLSNEIGEANYFFSSTGTYSAKITSNDYSKWSNPITVTVTEISTADTTATSTTSTTNQTGTGSTSNNQNNNLVSNSQINDTANKLINFLKSKQDADGKISDINTSDWSAIAFGSKNIYASDVKNSGKSLYDFIYNTKLDDIEKENNKCAGYARHTLALLSAGTPKTDSKITDLSNKLNTECVKNNIFGLPGINDDVFGLITALALKTDQNSALVATTLNAIKTDQQADGSFTWDGWSGADMTGAAINALKYAKNSGLSVDASVFTKAKQYLKSQQLADGGWGFGVSDALTTSWATMGINALGETQNDWFNSAGKNPWHILTTLDGDHYTQSWDGGIDWFGTKHAVPALLGNSWPIILDPKPNTNNQNDSGGANILTTTTISVPTSTLFSTTTATFSTSTITNTSTIFATTTAEIDIASSTNTITITTDKKIQPAIQKQNRTKQSSEQPSIITKNTNENEKNIVQEIKSGPDSQKDTDQIIDNLPLDTPTKKTAKKVLAVSGGSMLIVGAYLGLRLLRNMI